MAGYLLQVIITGNAKAGSSSSVAVQQFWVAQPQLLELMQKHSNASTAKARMIINQCSVGCKSREASKPEMQWLKDKHAVSRNTTKVLLIRLDGAKEAWGGGKDEGVPQPHSNRHATKFWEGEDGVWNAHMS